MLAVGSLGARGFEHPATFEARVDAGASSQLIGERGVHGAALEGEVEEGEGVADVVLAVGGGGGGRGVEGALLLGH